MCLKGVPFMLVAILMSCIFAAGEPQGSRVTSFNQNEPSQTTAASPTSTTTSSPDEFQEPIDITLDGKIFPLDIFSSGATIPQDFSINCVDCAINGDVSLSAGGSILDHKIPNPPDVTKIPSNFNFSDFWVGATFDSFNANFEFGINLTASTTNNAFAVPINKTTFTKTFENFLTLTAIIDMEIHGWVNTSNNVNLTYGFNFSVPPGSEILVDLEHMQRSLSLGFNESKLEPIPFNSTTSDLDIGIELSFRPSVTFIATLGAVDVDTSVQLAVNLDVPKLDVEVQQVHHVDSSCAPASPSLPPDQVYQNLTLLVPSIGFDVFEVFTESGKIPGLDLSTSQSFGQSQSKNISTTCYFFDPAKQALGAPPATKPSYLSSAARHHFSFAGVVMAIAMAVFMGI